MPITNTTRKAENAGGSVATATVTLNSTVAGNLVVVGAAIYNNSSVDITNPTCDDGGNTWTRLFAPVASVTTERLLATLFYSVLGTGGNRTIVITPGTGTFDFSIFAHEFEGEHASAPESGTPVTATGTTEILARTPFLVTTDRDCLFVGLLGLAATGTISENAAGTANYNLSNDHESSSSAQAGSMIWTILDGSLGGTQDAAWTIPTGPFWAAGVAAFKPDTLGNATPDAATPMGGVPILRRILRPANIHGRWR